MFEGDVLSNLGDEYIPKLRSYLQHKILHNLGFLKTGKMILLKLITFSCSDIKGRITHKPDEASDMFKYFPMARSCSYFILNTSNKDHNQALSLECSGSIARSKVPACQFAICSFSKMWRGYWLEYYQDYLGTCWREAGD